jgi:hypothetical protein
MTTRHPANRFRRTHAPLKRAYAQTGIAALHRRPLIGAQRGVCMQALVTEVLAAWREAERVAMQHPLGIA